VPARLVAFNEADWGPEDGVPYLQWRAARRAWCRDHGFSYPGLVGPDLPPDGPLGDVIEQINAERATRRSWFPGGVDDGR
jgi:hypothetical protein